MLCRNFLPDPSLLCSQIAQAVELDVYVEPYLYNNSPSKPSMTASSAMTVATGGSDSGDETSPPTSPESKQTPVEVESPEGYESNGYDLPEPGKGDGKNFVRQRTIRVKVGKAPLLVRETEELDSKQVRSFMSTACVECQG